MSLAKELDRILRRDLAMHVAWMPVATRFSLGDYGFRRAGIFEPIGNLREYGVEIEEVPGREVKLDFTSAAATSVRKVGDLTVDALPDSEVEAELHITFERERSLLLRSPRLVSRRIGNLAAVGQALARAWGRKDGLPWSWRYRVVSELFFGEDVTVLSTLQAGTKVVLSGKASALRSFEAARASAGISVDSTKSLGLSLVGKAGTIGLDLVRFTGRGIPRSIGDAPVSVAMEPAGWGDDEADADDL